MGSRSCLLVLTIGARPFHECDAPDPPDPIQKISSKVTTVPWLAHGSRPKAHSPGSWPNASGKIAVISVITPAKILEPSSKDLSSTHAPGSISPTLADQRIERAPRQVALMIRDGKAGSVPASAASLARRNRSNSSGSTLPRKRKSANRNDRLG